MRTTYLCNVLYVSLLFITSTALVGMDETTEKFMGSTDKLTLEDITKMNLFQLCTVPNDRSALLDIAIKKAIQKHIQAGASLEIKDKDGNTPLLSRLIHINGTPIFKPLIKAGAHFDVINNKKENVLHILANIYPGLDAYHASNILEKLLTHYQFNYVGNMSKKTKYDILVTLNRLSILKDIQQEIPVWPIIAFKKYLDTIMGDEKLKTIPVLVEQIYVFNKSKWLKLLHQKNSVGQMPYQKRLAVTGVKEDSFEIAQKLNPEKFDIYFKEAMQKNIKNILLDIKEPKIKPMPEGGTEFDFEEEEDIEMAG